MLERLRDDKVPESLTHDYKVQLPAKGDDKQVGKLLEQLTSFANTAGGVLVIGFDGKRWEMPGLANLDEDADVRRIDELSRLVEPTLPQLTPHIIRRKGASPLLLVGVRGSLARPHRVPLKYGGGFFARTNRGKYPMELPELRRSFLEADAWEREAEEFRRNRVRQAVDGGDVAGFHFPDGFFVHIVPLGRLRERHDLSIITSKVASFANSWMLSGDRHNRSNLDGWVSTIVGPDGNNLWIQVFRSGALEVCFRRTMIEAGAPGPNRLTGFDLDRHVATIGVHGLSWLAALEIGPPYAVFISAAGVAGWRWVNDTNLAASFGVFDRDFNLAPAILIEETPPNLADAMKPALDLIWQAGGWPDGTPNIDAEGRLKVPPALRAFSFRVDDT